jgi:hypothetical protein
MACRTTPRRSLRMPKMRESTNRRDDTHDSPSASGALLVHDDGQERRASSAGN